MSNELFITRTDETGKKITYTVLAVCSKYNMFEELRSILAEGGIMCYYMKEFTFRLGTQDVVGLHIRDIYAPNNNEFILIGI